MMCRFWHAVMPGCLTALWLVSTFAIAAAADGDTVRSEEASFRLQQVATGLQVPWGMTFLPDGRALVSERTAGRISLLEVDTGESTPVGNGPSDVFIKDNAGMLDVVTHPDVRDNDTVYYCYTAGTSTLNTMVVERARLSGTEFTDRERIFTALPWYHNSIVYGCRLAFRDNYLFVTMGDRWDLRHLSQSPGTHLGKVLRLHHDGTAPPDNPFADVPGALPEVWSLGNRNGQGLTVHPQTGDLWEHEHGPLGGDEVNVIEGGHNYGWPFISYGKEYSGAPVGEGLTEKDGLDQPVHWYVPSIAPSDMLIYSGDAYPAWRGDLFIGALALTHLNRLELDGRKVVHEERLLENRQLRVRMIEQGPDQLIYLGTDAGDIYRLVPGEAAR